MSPNFLFIESNTSGTGRLFAVRARSLGYNPIVLAADPSRYPYIQEHQIEFKRTDTEDVNGIIRTIRNLQRKSDIKGVTSSSDYFMHTAAVIAREMGLPGPNPDAIGSSRRKSAQYTRLASAGIGTPEHWVVESPNGIARAVNAIAMPVVIKPDSGTGSIGTKRCDTVAEAAEHVSALLARRTTERGTRAEQTVAVTRYVSGPEYSVELFSGEVIGITRKRLSPEPLFVEIGHDFPAVLTAEDQEALATASQRAIDVLGLRWGPVHVELRLSPQGPVVIEVNARLAGGYIPELVRTARGIDLIRETIRLAVGETPDLNPRSNRNASIRFVVISEAGQISQFSGSDAARHTPGVEEIHWYRRRGDLVTVCGDFRDRIGHVMASGADHSSAIQAAERALAHLGIEYAGQMEAAAQTAV